MRLIFLMVAAMAVAAPAAAQEPQATVPGTAAPAPAEVTAEPPVSLDRIRDSLARSPESSLLRDVQRAPDFAVAIEEQARIDAMMATLDFGNPKAPVPAGGLYAYEQQRRLFNPTSRPLQQPYAAFSGSELITIAIENLIGRYLGVPALKALSASERSRTERAAKEAVDRDIAEYCAGRPDRASIQLCTEPPSRER